MCAYNQAKNKVKGFELKSKVTYHHFVHDSQKPATQDLLFWAKLFRQMPHGRSHTNNRSGSQINSVFSIH
jgi:hypothetical protein